MSYSHLIVESITLDPNSIFIYFQNTNNYLQLEPYGDCCSSAYVLFPKDFDEKSIIGKKILDILILCTGYTELSKTGTYDDIDENYDNVYGTSEHYNNNYEELIEYHLIFDDDTTQKFLLYGLSNGYYHATLSMNLIKIDAKKEKESGNENENENENGKENEEFHNNIIFIIGLPGSGKTSLIEERFKDKKVFDDFLSSIDISSIINWIKNHPTEDVIFSDPRLTNSGTFKSFVSACSSVFHGSNINLTMFDNNYERCMFNIKNSGSYIKPRLISLNRLRYKYNPNDQIYFNYPIEKIKVFDSTLIKK